MYQGRAQRQRMLPVAVVLDLEGTLVETENVWWQAEEEFVKARHGRWNERLAHSLLGATMDQIGGRLFEAVGRPDDLAPGEIVDELVKKVVSALRRDVRWRPGALEFLGMLATRHVPLAVVTPAYRPIVDVVLSHLWDEMFWATVAGEEVKRPRPHPESYLLAARKLNVEPQDCIAVDSWPAGLAAAEEAGYCTVAVPNHTEIRPAPGRLVPRSLAEVDMGMLRTLAETEL